MIKTTKQTAGLNDIVTTSSSSNSGSNSNISGKATSCSDGADGKVKVDMSGEISYVDAVKIILETDGWAGLFGRGLQTRLLTNAIQGATFSVLWRYFQETGN